MITREDLERRLALLRRQQADVQRRSEALAQDMRALTVAIEENMSWLHLVSQREQEGS